MKTICVYHSIDLDGWMSAAIVKHWFKSNNTRYFIKNLNTTATEGTLSVGNQELYFLGYNYGQPIPDLSEYDKVIMCDISFPADEMFRIYYYFDDGEFIWLDHHKSAIDDSEGRDYESTEGIRSTNFSACELTWQYFFPNKPMPEIVRLLGLYDSFRHKGTYEEEKVLGFQYGARQRISNYEQAYEWLTMYLDHPEICNEIQNAGDEIYEYLRTEAEQTYKNGFEIKLEEPNVFTVEFGSTNTVIRKFICINKERFNPINFGIDYHADGYDGVACFWYDGKQWAFSLYNDNGEVDCSQIAKQYEGGGHKGAAGFRLNNEQFLKFISE